MKETDTQAGRMRRLGLLLSGDLSAREQKEFLTLGTEFLSALATDLGMTEVTVTQDRAAVTGYSGQVRLKGRQSDVGRLVIDLEQNFLTFQEEQSCLYCRPEGVHDVRPWNCAAIGLPMLQDGDYGGLLKRLRAMCEGGDAVGSDAA